ncbi:MAG: pentapeptide repeat-containing protein [Pseudomonadales bacterium]|nr:pentapeptide repeat-containing protein [Pseudomonadales bacterium]NRA15178.1 pentapeptide repeat-containing protein [Oceanospirillaceae bacterium]
MNKEKMKIHLTNGLNEKTIKAFALIPSRALWLIWDFSGARFIWHKIRPLKESKNKPPGYRTPSTFILWCITIYVAAFGLTSQRFENKLDKAEHKANILVAQLGTDNFSSIIAGIPRIQKAECPVEPSILDYHSIFSSIFSPNGICKSVVNDLKGVVSDWRMDLAEVNLNGADLSGANLFNANFVDADLSWADLSLADLSLADLIEASLFEANLFEADLFYADLSKADLSGAYLRCADLSSANLRGANLSEADLSEANFSEVNLSEANLSRAKLRGAKLRGANLRGADLSEADFSGAKSITYNQLLTVSTLYQTKGLDLLLNAKLKENKPELFDKPEDKN